MSLYDRDYMRDGPVPPRRSAPGFNFFGAVFFLNLAVFFVQFVLGEGWIRDPLEGDRPMGGVSLDDLSEGRYWGLLTYMFVHGGPLHILMNMLVLWFAGKRVQQIYGPVRFLQIYLLSGIVGAAAELSVAALVMDTTAVSLIGASAACFGVLMAFAAARPQEPIVAMIYFVIPIRTRMRTFAFVLVGINLVLGVLALVDLLPGWMNGTGGMVAYFAHLGGAAAGWYLGRAMSQNSGQTGFMAESPGMPVRRRRPEMARVTRRPVVELEVEAIQGQNGHRDPTMDLIRDEVDPILDKISEQGMHSLTDEERRTLDRASRQMRRDRKN